MDPTLRRRHTQVLYDDGDGRRSETDEAEDERKIKKLRSATTGTLSEESTAPKRRFPLKPRSSPPPVPAVTAVRKLTCRAEEPWERAKKMFVQKGTIICNGRSWQQLHVAVKQRQIVQGDDQHLRHVSHKYIVNLLDACLVLDTLYLIYEYMDVSLRNIASLTKKLSYSDIGTVCKSVSPHRLLENKLTYTLSYVKDCSSFMTKLRSHSAIWTAVTFSSTEEGISE